MPLRSTLYYWLECAPRWLVAVLLVVALAGCSTPVRVGDPCTTIGAEARTRSGAVLVCKAPAKSDPTGKARWRRP